LGRFPSVNVDLKLIILTGGLVTVDRSCDAFEPARAFAQWLGAQRYRDEWKTQWIDLAQR